MRRLAAVAALLGILSACSGSDSDVRRFVAEIKERPPGRIEPIPLIKPERVVSGSFARDPFEPLVGVEPRDSGRPTQPTPAPGPLARVDASRVRLLRSYWDLDQPAALVETPNRDLYRLVLGDRIGGWVLSAIEQDRLMLVDGRGKELAVIAAPN